jgi:signal transduction histidine kinase
MIAPQIAAKKLNYAVVMDDEPMWVTADRAKLVQIILNLLSNAVKFTESGGSVKVHYCDPAQEDSSESVYLCITDTGMGIPQEKLQAVFDPFVQLATSHSKRHEGTGLGLAISRDLARGMGGDIRATSQEGQGTTFMVVLSKAS